MAPIAIDEKKSVSNGSSLKSTALSSRPSVTPDASRYHASSSKDAITTEATHAAHNYHPLPVVFARASGCSVWDPVRNSLVKTFDGSFTDLCPLTGRKTLPRLPFRLQRREPRPLPPRTRKGSDGTGAAIGPELESVLQRCLSQVCGVRYKNVWL